MQDGNISGSVNAVDLPQNKIKNSHFVFLREKKRGNHTDLGQYESGNYIIDVIIMTTFWVKMRMLNKEI